MDPDGLIYVPQLSQVELFKRIADYTKMNESEYYLDCITSWEEMYNDVKGTSGTCWASIAGIEVTTADIQAGVQFTWPVYKQGAHDSGMTAVHACRWGNDCGTCMRYNDCGTCMCAV